MEDPNQNPLPGQSRSTPVELRDGPEEPERMLDRLSRELDIYFAVNGFRGMR